MESRFESRDIIKLLDLMIGGTEAVGESNYDHTALKNLKTLIDVMDWGLDKVRESSKTYGRPEASMHEVGWNAHFALNTWRDWLIDVTKV